MLQQVPGCYLLIGDGDNGFAGGEHLGPCSVHNPHYDTVFSDGLACFGAVTAPGCTHQPTVVGGRKPKDLPEFRWINTVLGNLKTSLTGSYHAFDFRKYAAR